LARALELQAAAVEGGDGGGQGVQAVSRRREALRLGDSGGNVGGGGLYLDRSGDGRRRRDRLWPFGLEQSVDGRISQADVDAGLRPEGQQAFDGPGLR